MVLKDLSKRRVGSLELPWDGVTYVVTPPSAARGEVLTKFVSLGLAALMDSDSVTDELMKAELGDQLQNFDEPYAIEKFAIGEDVWDKMYANGMVLADMQMLARYATYYWIFGAEAADKLSDDSPSEGVEGGSVVFPKAAKSGPSTASPARSARPAGTPATTSRSRSAKPSGSKSRTARPVRSPGKTSAPGGTPT